MFKNTATRRGTAIAAAALSLAMVAPSIAPMASAADAPAATAEDQKTPVLEYAKDVEVTLGDSVELKPTKSENLKKADSNTLVYSIVDDNGVAGTKTEVSVKDGVVTVKPKETAKAGEVIEFVVKVEAKDGNNVVTTATTEKVAVKVVAAKPVVGTLTYDTESKIVDGKIVIEPTATNLQQNADDKVSYSIVAAEEGADAPEGVAVDDKGVITVTPKKPGALKFKVKAEAKNAAGEVTRTTTSTVVTVQIADSAANVKGSLTYKDAANATVAQKGKLVLAVEAKNLKVKETDTVTFTVDGPASVSTDKDGNVTVTPAETAKVGDTIEFKVKAEAKDAAGVVTKTTESGKVTVKVVEAPKVDPAPTTPNTGLSEKCKTTLLGAGIPLLALIPLGLLSQIAIGSSANVTNVLDQQIRNINAEIQRQAGILNPELAKQVEALDKYLTAFGYSVASAAIGLAALAGGLTASSFIIRDCLVNQGGTKVTVKGEIQK
ncbi:hypothetical protein JKI95_08045 [Corynebacterium aquatimens]|uniref:hypothetical protein n=1 Tax=Corynebacterium TaxID=1716 RepID=UPI001F22B88D|nr:MULTISPECIES: hypothetical protein [Corynebacterium]QYH19172.1 hypothetical protein JKI95_08045 [Corynebacterium aquatimens]UIZ91949.1 hypothetical protein JZY91_09735 [Corynebacterium sp. CNCTC7651]